MLSGQLTLANVLAEPRPHAVCLPVILSQRFQGIIDRFGKAGSDARSDVGVLRMAQPATLEILFVLNPVVQHFKLFNRLLYHDQTLRASPPIDCRPLQSNQSVTSCFPNHVPSPDPTSVHPPP